MNKLTKLSFAALGGITVLMLAVPADAAIKRTRFSASMDELRRYCMRIDEDFWRAKRSYGCGDKIGCTSGSCRVFKEPPPPPPNCTYCVRKDGGGNGSDGGKKSGGNDGGDGGQGSSAAGGPN